MIRKISLFLCTLFLLLAPLNTFALSGSYDINSSSSVQVGDTISVKFTIKASKMFYWQAYITYDNSHLQLVSGSTTFQGESDSINGQGSVSKTLKFKAKKAGSSWVAIAMGSSGYNINNNSESISFSKKSKTINIKEKTVKTATKVLVPSHEKVDDDSDMITMHQTPVIAIADPSSTFQQNAQDKLVKRGKGKQQRRKDIVFQKKPKRL